MDASPRRREILLATVAALAAAVLWSVGWLQPLERPVTDALLRLQVAGDAAQTPVAAVLIDDQAVARLGPLPWPRQRLAHLVRSARSLGARAVVVDVILSEPGDAQGDGALSAALDAGPSVLAAVLLPRGGWLLPLERFGGGGRSAHAHAEVGPDGVVRSVAASKQDGLLSLPALAVAAARLAGSEAVFAPGHLLRPDFRIRPERLVQMSAAAVLDQPTAVSLRDRVVFIGISAAGASDSFVVPTTGTGAPHPGVLVHAAVAATILDGGLLRSLPLGWMIVLALILSLIVQVLRTADGKLRGWHLAVGAGAILMLAPLALWAFHLVLPTVTLLLAVVISAVAREATESREAQLQSGVLLTSLLAEAGSEVETPSGAAGRLRLLERLQGQLIRDRDLRRTLLESLAEGVVLWDEAGEPLLVNRAITRLWGSRPRLTEVRREREPQAESSGTVGELRRHNRDLQVEVRELDVGHLGLVRDISERQELERRRREMQRLVAHELKTPLASLAGFGRMLERYSLSAEELGRVAALIRGESERLGEMVSTFLELERLRTDHWQGERAMLDLAQLVRERCRVLSAAASEREQEIVVETVGAAMVEGVAELLLRVVDNLVGNALKFSPAGSTIEVSVVEDGGRVVLEVRDHGPGIPPEALPRLFERFFRAPGVEAPGSGLGLALVQEVVDWHEGCVQVDSEEGAGATFTVSLPATRSGDEEA